jgi:endo-1,4-beta-xylanase
MTWSARRWIVSCCLAVCLASPACAQTFTGSSLSHKSSGSGSGNWTLDENGYVGTYITLAAPGQVTLTVNASGATSDATAPHMNVVVADTKASFDVSAGFNNYEHTFDLPAGTHFIRTEFNNDIPAASRQLTIASLNVSGATSVSNTTNQNTNNASALTAADTYIDNFRKGPAQLALSGVAPGSDVHVKLKQHDFNFGTAVGGTFVGNGGNQYDVNTYLNNSNYTNFLLTHFNTVTQGNAGKWGGNESTRDVVTMSASDRIDQYAVDHNLRVRQHNLIWGSQQPAWVTAMLNNPDAIDTTAGQPQGLTNRDALRQEISERIDYYIGNNDANTTDDRASKYKYVEMDLLNEEVHQPKYWSIYGANGIADVFNETAAAVTGAGANTRLALNEYNILQFGADIYGNWYRHDAESILNNGGAISALGVQYYPFSATGSNAHSPARIEQIFQNLAVTGLPISLTEFGVQTGGGTTVQQAATYLTDTMRMVFGMPGATTFDIWGFWANDIWSQAPLAALMDANWNLTLPGTAYEALMSEWDTDLMLPVGPDGTIDFSGFFGDYEITVGDQTFDLNLLKGTQQYSLVVDLGDYNGDGIVDAGDYTVWRNSLGSTDDLRADGNGDRMVDEADYAIWKSNFGTNYGSGSGQLSVAVPEPASIAMLLLAGLSVGRFRNRTRRSRREQ